MRRVSNIASIVVIATVSFNEGCSSDKASPAAISNTASTGGAEGIADSSTTGGASSVVDGSSTSNVSSMDTHSGSGGTTGRDCTPSAILFAPSNGIIASFSDADAGSDFGGKIVAYPFDASAPKFSTAAGSLHVTQDIPATTSGQYTGVAVGFGHCVDATAFTGIQFAISGTYSGCTMKYMSGDVAHQDATLGGLFATGQVGAYQPQSAIASAQLSSTPTTLKMPFNETTFSGNPSTPINPSKLIFVAWQFDIAAGATAPNCVADITIDDVEFY